MRGLLLFLIFQLPFGGLFASVENISSMLQKNGLSSYPEIVRNLTNEKLYFTSVPFIKEYLLRTSLTRNEVLDKLIDEVITHVGSKQFEVLPETVLRKSNAPSIRYILARKLFRTGNYDEAINLLGNNIPENHPVKPFSLMLSASILSISGKYAEAIKDYKYCIDASESGLGRAEDESLKRQLNINRDYCVVGIPRTEFAGKNNKNANLSYLDLSKESYVWPEILFEEAWNSFYLRDYNRTLGKLVTYRAPVFSYMFNPEIETLKALTYMELCLYEDARKVVDGFYSDYQSGAKELNSFLNTYKKDYRAFYMEAKKREKGISRVEESLTDKLLKSSTRDPIYQELKYRFLMGGNELKKIKSIGNSQTRSVLTSGLRDALLLQRNLVGGHVRKTLMNYNHQIQKTFEGMSFIKLEVLSRRKSDLYTVNKGQERERGDIEYLQRNDKQYFWSFNAEFWADELGDYVFALRSECK